MVDKAPSPHLLHPESPTTAREPDFDDTPDVSELSIHPRGAAEGTPTLGSQPLRTSAGNDPRTPAEAGAGLGLETVDITETTGTTTVSGPTAHLFTNLGESEKQALTTLIDAFPDVEARMVKAVLRAGDFKTEKAFEALLEYSDPSYVVEDPAPPPPPPRPSQRSQLETDEELARRLAAEFNQASRRSEDNDYRPELPRRRHQRDVEDEEGREPSFFEDELPKIGKHIQQGFLETQSRFNKMLSDFKKKIDGEDSDEDRPGREYESRYGQSSRHNQERFDTQQSSYDQIYGTGGNNFSTGQARQGRDHRTNPGAGSGGPYGTGSGRSNSLYRDPTYDADPRVLDADDLYGDSFRLSTASPNGSALKTPGAPGRVKSPAVKFADVPMGATGSGDGLGTGGFSTPRGSVDGPRSSVTNTPASGGGSGKKWQPLNNPMPLANRDRDRDPFELGDSDEEDGPASATTPSAAGSGKPSSKTAAPVVSETTPISAGAGGKIALEDQDVSPSADK